MAAISTWKSHNESSSCLRVRGHGFGLTFAFSFFESSILVPVALPLPALLAIEDGNIVSPFCRIAASKEVLCFFERKLRRLLYVLFPTCALPNSSLHVLREKERDGRGKRETEEEKERRRERAGGERARSEDTRKGLRERERGEETGEERVSDCTKGKHKLEAKGLIVPRIRGFIRSPEDKHGWGK